MGSRKGSSNTTPNVSTNDTMSYINEISHQSRLYRNGNKNEEALLLIRRNVSLLVSSCAPEQIVNLNCETAKLFVDLHVLMGVLSPDSEGLWACLSVLEHFSKNPMVSKALVKEYCFVPLLVYVLKKTHAEDKQRRLLQLLQELSYGIKIQRDEP